MKELKFNLKNMINKKEFYLAIMGVLLINLIHVILVVNRVISLKTPLEKTMTAEYQFLFYNSEITFGAIIVIALPILCGAIFSDCNVLENARKTTNLLHVRINPKKNIFVRAVLSFFLTFSISLFGFLLNYFLLRIIFGSGNLITFSQELPFFQYPDTVFLGNILNSNPTLFVFLICSLVSITLGLISSLSYLLSNLVNRKIIIYFIPFILIILWEVITIVLKVHSISILSALQPFETSKLSLYVKVFAILGIFNVLAFLLSLFKKDTLL